MPTRTTTSTGTGSVPFRAWLDGMPNLGQGAGWTARQWRRAPRRRVPVRALIATNRARYLDPRRVARYRHGGGGDPYVIAHTGRLYVADGHHRITAAALRGDSTIRARVITIEAGSTPR